MVVEIDFDHGGTGIDDEMSGFLMLKNDEREESYASWPFHVNPAEHYLHGEAHVWEWKTPDKPIEAITLDPSLKLEWDEPNTFHIFVRDGRVHHCGDCKCGCE